MKIKLKRKTINYLWRKINLNMIKLKKLLMV